MPDSNLTFIDPTSSPWFGGDTSFMEGGGSLGVGDGSDWADWSSILSPDQYSSFLTQADGPNRGTDNRLNGKVFDKNSFLNWLSGNNYRLGETNNNSVYNRGVYDSSGKLVSGQTQGIYDGSGGAELFGLASLFFNPFGGIAAGGAAGGAAASMGLSGAAASATNSALTGALTTAGEGGSDKDILRGALSGGLAGGYSPNVSGYVGLGNGPIGQAVNGAVRGGLQGALNGGGRGAGQGAVMGGLTSGLNALGTSNSGGSQMEGGYSRSPFGGSSPSFNAAAGLSSPDVYGSSPAPWASPTLNFASGDPAESYQPQETFRSSALGQFMNNLIPQTPERLGDLAQGLLGMYSGHRRRQMAKEMMGRFGSNRDSYLANLRGQLTARDARSGRRSNFAGRETELQARLAELDSRNAPAMAQLSDARFSGLEAMLASGLRMGGNMGLFGSRYQRPEQAQRPMPELPSVQSSTMDYSLDPRRFRLGYGE